MQRIATLVSRVQARPARQSPPSLPPLPAARAATLSIADTFIHVGPRRLEEQGSPEITIVFYYVPLTQCGCKHRLSTLGKPYWSLDMTSVSTSRRFALTAGHKAEYQALAKLLR